MIGSKTKINILNLDKPDIQENIKYEDMKHEDLCEEFHNGMIDHEKRWKILFILSNKDSAIVREQIANLCSNIESSNSLDLILFSYYILEKSFTEPKCIDFFMQLDIIRTLNTIKNENSI